MKNTIIRLSIVLLVSCVLSVDGQHYSANDVPLSVIQKQTYLYRKAAIDNREYLKKKFNIND